MTQNTHWSDDATRRSDSSGTTILAVIAVIILAGLVYLAAHGLGPTTGGTSVPTASTSTTAPSVIAPNPAAPAAPAAPTPPAGAGAPATTTP